MLGATDVIVWILAAEGIFTLSSCVLMLLEPMTCGGSNRSLHRVLALFIFAASISAFNRAWARSAALALDGPAIPASALLASDLFMLLASIALTAKLGYDYVRYREYMKVISRRPRCAQKDCPQKAMHPK